MIELLEISLRQPDSTEKGGVVAEVEILADDLLVYAHVDQQSDEAVVAFDPEVGTLALTQVYREVVERGYVRVRAQWHDADWKRDMVVLIKEEQ